MVQGRDQGMVQGVVQGVVVQGVVQGGRWAPCRLDCNMSSSSPPDALSAPVLMPSVPLCWRRYRVVEIW